MKKTRRRFIKHSGQLALGLGLSGLISCGNDPQKAQEEDSSAIITGDSKELFFKISLAQWSLNKSLGWGSKQKPTLNKLAFPAKARGFGIEAVEYVSRFIDIKDRKFIPELNRIANLNGVKNLLIMVDDEGNLGDTDTKKRMQAVTNHYNWINAAKQLGCHSIRVNAAGQGTRSEVADAAIEGLGKLTEYGASEGINVIVENHGGFSSDGEWLSNVIKKVNSDYCGTLPDFGNFCVEYGENGCAKAYDKYKGVRELMPFAKAVSAKSNNFDAKGNETGIDYLKMMKIVKEFGYTGYVGIEYEGPNEDQGIIATKKLLEKVGMMIS